VKKASGSDWRFGTHVLPMSVLLDIVNSTPRNGNHDGIAI
jgi:hypothetical protein